MTNDMLLNAVRINTETDPWITDDQMFVRTPIVFPQIQFELIDTAPLNAMADQIREADHELPCFYGKDGAIDNDGYYRFFITLYGVWPGCENCIVFDYCGGNGETEQYQIDLTDEQRLAIFAMLNRECEMVFDESAIDMMLEYARDNHLGWNGMMNE